MSDTRINLYWGPSHSDYGPAGFLHKALQRLPRVQAYRYECWGKPELFGKADMHLMVDWAEDIAGQGKYADFLPSAPRAYWVSDTHASPESMAYRVKKASTCKWIAYNIRNDRNVFDALEQESMPKDTPYRWMYPKARSAAWIPYAAEPLLWAPMPDEKVVYDVGFVGHYGTYDARREFVEAMMDEFGEKAYIEAQKFIEDAVQAMARCKVTLNHCQADSTNMRTFELMSMGSCMLHPLTSDLAVLGFKDGVHLLTYQSIEEAVDKAHWALAHDEKRQLIGRYAREAILAGHTYVHRAAYFAGLAGWKGMEHEIETAMNTLPKEY